MQLFRTHLTEWTVKKSACCYSLLHKHLPLRLDTLPGPCSRHLGMYTVIEGSVYDGGNRTDDIRCRFNDMIRFSVNAWRFIVR